MNFNQLFTLITEGSAPRDYSCLMLDLSFLTEDVVQLHEEICPCDVLDEPGKGLELDTHVTVCYGLTEELPSNVLPKLSLKPVTLKIGGISLFQSEKQDVLKFDIISKDLNTLNKEVMEKFEVHTSFPDYHAHCTIAYLQPGAGKYYKKMKCPLIGKTFTSNRFIFSSPSSEKVWHDV